MRKHLGNRTHGGGNTKNRRGKGSKGGKGRGGFHKHKRMHYIVMGEISSTEPGFVNPTRKEFIAVNLREISKGISNGKYKKEGDAYAVDLTVKKKLIKVLSGGAISQKANVKANAFSEVAKEKIEKAGGKAVLAQ